MVRQSTVVTPEPILGLLVFHHMLQLLVSPVVVSKLVHSYSALPSVYMRLHFFLFCVSFSFRGDRATCIRMNVKLGSRSDTSQVG